MCLGLVFYVAMCIAQMVSLVLTKQHLSTAEIAVLVYGYTATMLVCYFGISKYLLLGGLLRVQQIRREAVATAVGWIGSYVSSALTAVLLYVAPATALLLYEATGSAPKILLELADFASEPIPFYTLWYTPVAFATAGNIGFALANYKLFRATRNVLFIATAVLMTTTTVLAFASAFTTQSTYASLAPLALGVATATTMILAIKKEMKKQT